MQKLKADDIIYLSESVIRALTQNRIKTLVEFLQEDISKLATITKLNLPQILAIRNEIFAKYSAPVLSYITELCGLADSGKTQLCFQLSINCARKSNNAGEVSTTAKDTFTEKRNRCLGRYWQQIPYLVLLLEKSQENNAVENGSQIDLSVIKSNNVERETNQCSLNISGLGVT
ncbi:Rad51A protein [Operophtera brumata]|uniref:Rad51A protein n=1 Tax=Operophtera brumata TaxID=104452 RepID=A0A0L7LGQ2_OPEBR|nr:Rad51A protein [Operophtera brumata]